MPKVLATAAAVAIWLSGCGTLSTGIHLRDPDLVRIEVDGPHGRQTVLPGPPMRVPDSGEIPAGKGTIVVTRAGRRLVFSPHVSGVPWMMFDGSLWLKGSWQSAVPNPPLAGTDFSVPLHLAVDVTGISKVRADAWLTTPSTNVESIVQLAEPPRMAGAFEILGGVAAIVAGSVILERKVSVPAGAVLISIGSVATLWGYISVATEAWPVEVWPPRR